MALPWKAEYDKRQYDLMAHHIQQFREGRADLSSLIAGLEALVNALDAPDDHWKNEFQRKWAVLEEVNAVALNEVEEGASLSADDVLNRPGNLELVAATISDMQRLLAECQHR
jgi:hypothetical protein